LGGHCPAAAGPVHDISEPGAAVGIPGHFASQFLNDVDQGKIRDVVIQGQEIHGTYVDGRGFDTYVPNDPTLLQA
jgi:hypothetical protein